MNNSIQIACFAGTLAVLAGCASGKTGREAGLEQTLLVRVYDEAQIPAEALHSALAETDPSVPSYRVPDQLGAPHGRIAGR